MHQKRIIIIGGGIGGLMTAIALNKKGIVSTIYEKAKSYDANGAGLALWANATCILSKYGLLNDVLEHSSVMTAIKTSTSNGSHLNLVRLNKLEDKFHFPSIVLLRQDLQKVLLNTVPASQIQFNKQFIKAESHSKTVTIHFSDGTQETADAVIFADGIRSIARNNPFQLPPLKYAGRTSWRGVAQFKTDFFSDNTNIEILGKGRRIGIFPLPNNLAYWYAAVNMTLQEAEKQKRTLDCVLSHFKGWAEPVNTLIQSTSEDRLILTNINYSSEINKLAHENIALLGDAAHPMTPDLGQGACQAIEDADVLAECLSSGISVSDGFKQYENKRLTRVRDIALNSLRIGRMRQIENPIGVTFRDNLFRFLPEKFALKILERNIATKSSTNP